ncbi:nucleotide-binding protein [Glutamicibacter ardleyensis]|uniref:nucleotide-binding protein n=1 Tax=Glutamicibacter ardleyensis TaxID=225894 RepID=UPI003FD09D42
MNEKIYVGLIGASELREALESTGSIECITGSITLVSKEIRRLTAETGAIIPVFVEDPESSDAGLQRWCDVFPSKTGISVTIIRQGEVPTLRTEDLPELHAPLQVNALLESVGLPQFEQLDDQTFPPGAFIQPTRSEPELADELVDELDLLEQELEASEANRMVSVDSSSRPATDERAFAQGSNPEVPRGRRSSENSPRASESDNNSPQYDPEQYVETHEPQNRNEGYRQSIQEFDEQAPGRPHVQDFGQHENSSQGSSSGEYQQGQYDRFDPPGYNVQPENMQERAPYVPPQQNRGQGQYGQSEQPEPYAQNWNGNHEQNMHGGYQNQSGYSQFDQRGTSQYQQDQRYGQNQGYNQPPMHPGAPTENQYGYNQPPMGQPGYPQNNQPNTYSQQNRSYVRQQENQNYGRQQVGHAVIVMSSKGGVGKSTTSLQLAHEAGKAGIRTILVDGNSGQGDLMTMLGIERSGLPTIQDASLSNDVGVCFIEPEQINHYRPHDADQATFGFVAAPLAGTNRRGDVDHYFYAQVIQEARNRAELVIIDTQILENDDKTGVIEDLLVPVLQTANGWAIAVTECSAVSVNSMELRLRHLTSEMNIPASKFMTLFNKVDAEDMEGVVAGHAEAFRGFGELLGAIPVSREAKLALDAHGLELETPMFSKRIVQALLRVDRSDSLLNRDREIEEAMAGPEKEPNFLMRLFSKASKSKKKG